MRLTRSLAKPVILTYILTGQSNRSKMKQIQATEAKAKFAEILRTVESGGTIEITRHGRPIARMTPIHTSRQEESRRAIAAIREAQKRAPRATVEEILAWRDEGRK
jgi:prevent-host-death family protein